MADKLTGIFIIFFHAFIVISGLVKEPFFSNESTTDAKLTSFSNIFS